MKKRHVFLIIIGFIALALLTVSAQAAERPGRETKNSFPRSNSVDLSENTTPEHTPPPPHNDEDDEEDYEGDYEEDHRTDFLDDHSARRNSSSQSNLTLQLDSYQTAADVYETSAHFFATDESKKDSESSRQPSRQPDKQSDKQAINRLRTVVQEKNHQAFSALMDRLEDQNKEKGAAKKSPVDRDSADPDSPPTLMKRYQQALIVHYKAKGLEELEHNALLMSVKNYHEAENTPQAELKAYEKVAESYYKESRRDPALVKPAQNYLQAFRAYSAVFQKHHYKMDHPDVITAHSKMSGTHAQLLSAYYKAQFVDDLPNPEDKEDFEARLRSVEESKRSTQKLRSPVRCSETSLAGSGSVKPEPPRAKGVLYNDQFPSLSGISVEGTIFDQALADKRMFPRGSAVITRSGKLVSSGIQGIIHAAPGAAGTDPDRPSPKTDPTIASIKTSLMNSLILGNRAFPDGNGEILVPFLGGNLFAASIAQSKEPAEIAKVKKKIAEEMVKTALEFLKAHPQSPSIRFTSSWKNELDLLRNALAGQRGQLHGSSINPNKIQIYDGLITSDKFKTSEGSIVTYDSRKPRVIVNAANMQQEWGGGLSSYIGNAVGGKLKGNGEDWDGAESTEESRDIQDYLHSQRKLFNKAAKALKP